MVKNRRFLKRAIFERNRHFLKLSVLQGNQIHYTLFTQNFTYDEK